MTVVWLVSLKVQRAVVVPGRTFPPSRGRVTAVAAAGMDQRGPGQHNGLPPSPAIPSRVEEGVGQREAVQSQQSPVGYRRRWFANEMVRVTIFPFSYEMMRLVEGRSAFPTRMCESEKLSTFASDPSRGE